MGRPWVPRLVTRGDRAAATALLDLGFVRRQNGARRVARMLREFLDRNPRLKEDPSQAWLLFVGQLVNEKRNGVRVRSYSTVLQSLKLQVSLVLKPDFCCTFARSRDRFDVNLTRIRV